MNALILFFLALGVYISLEFIRIKLKLDEVNQKSKELVEKLKGREELDEEALSQILEIQKQMYKYFIISSAIVVAALILIKIVLGDAKVLELPFIVPILNRNWLGALGTYILFYFLISLVGGIAKKVYKNFVKKEANGEKSSNS